MAFTAKDVKDLREKTGCGMMDCKKALTESNGDMGAAIDFLREKGLAAAAKKSGRIAAEGLAVAYTNDKNNTGVAIEVNAETDFVAKNADFQTFVKECAQTIIEQNPNSVEELLKMNITNQNKTVESALQEKILTIGENIKIRRFRRMEGNIATYVHAGGKIGVMVKFDSDSDVSSSDDFKSLGKDVAMQIAAVNPQYLNKESVPENVVAYEKKILKEQIINDGKPENIAEKIVEGRINKFYKENCLLDQPFVKENSISVRDHIKLVAGKLGCKLEITDFVRFEKGEGIEKRENDFADEVKNLIK
ncbi:MAG: translation elongation factor Ts [Oscillospiraceae bacterium]|jgi:elongation factor Ts|nr:translation elongation factor Ts [Oscillospiraceae bacterium]